MCYLVRYLRTRKRLIKRKLTQQSMIQVVRESILILNVTRLEMAENTERVLVGLLHTYMILGKSRQM